MKNWEFLLQREGDTTWLPLETPDVEILEGRYRVVARSGYPNAKIEIRITHHALEETPPVRRVQTRTTNTSAEGLMVVIPHTRLKPGIWELSCSPHLQGSLVNNKSSDNLVKLRVLSHDDEPVEEPLPSNDAPPSDSSVETDSSDDLQEAISVSDEPVCEENHRQDPIETAATEKSIVEIIDERNSTSQTPPPQAQPELAPSESINPDNPTPIPETETHPTPSETEFAIASDQSPDSSVEIESTQTESSEPVTPESPSEDLTINADEIQLTLERDSFVAKLGQALLISGRVEAAAASEPSNEQPAQYCLNRADLEVYLRDPHNSNILLHVQQPIPQSILPIPFSGLIYIPFECQTRLILGEAVISSNGEAVTRHSFNIATEVEHLLQALEIEGSSQAEIEIIPPQPEEAKPENRLHLIDPNASPSPEPPPPPPDVRRPTVPVTQANPQTPKKETTPSSLELPSFGHFLSENSEQPADPTTAPPEQPTPTSQDAADAESLTPTEETSTEPAPPETDQDGGQLVPVSPVDPAFRALNLENRFWSRLNALAQDRDLSQWMKQAKPTPLPDTSFVQTRPAEPPETSVPSPPADDGEPLFPSFDEDLESQEIVVDDEPPEASPSPPPTKPTLRLIDSRRTQSPTSEPSTAISDDEPIPPPVLEAIDPEIVAGRKVKVRVRLPENLPRIYVKIWVYDRQSRSIVDGPRWLTEFSPNGLNQIETTVNLEIAYGSLEVQFEAIAVEMQTQRESHKVIVERSVVPPAAPTLPLDEE